MVIGVEDSGQNSINVIPGANGCVTPDDVIAAEELFPSADILLVQFEIPPPAVQKAIELAHRHGVQIILDPARLVSVIRVYPTPVSPGRRVFTNRYLQNA